MNTFPRKIVIGDSSKDSDQLLSTWVLSSFAGGGQVEEIEEGVHNDRFYFATLDTRYPSQLALPPKTTTVAGPNTDGCRPLGEIAGKLVVAFGTVLSHFDSAFVRIDHGGALTAAPVARGANFKGNGTLRLFIPQGSAGYQTWDGTTLAAGTAGITPVEFAEWDGKLFAFEHNGGLSSYDGTTWTTDIVTLDGSLTPKHLVAYLNRADAPTLHLVTDRDVWAYDADIPKLYRTHVQFPKHPDQGLAAAEWRGDLYVSVGPGVHRYTGATLSAMGLDRDDGLPFAYRGKILDLLPEYNGLYALVQGATASTGATEVWLWDAMFDDAWFFSETVSNNALFQWTGFGWHTLWATDQAGGAPTWAMLSTTADYRLVWGNAGNLLYQKLRIQFYNPKQGAVAGVDEFAPSGTLETGWFDAAMKGFPKGASHLTVNAGRAAAAQRITVLYRRDFEEGWTALGQVAAAGEATLVFGTGEFGRGFERIDFLIGLDSDDADDSPILDSAILHFVKIPHEAFAWTARIDLSHEDGWNGLSNQALSDKLDALLRQNEPPFYSMVHRQTTYRVRLAQVQGDDATGLDDRGTRTISIVQIPTETA